MRTLCFGISCIVLFLSGIRVDAQDLRVAGNIGIGTVPDTKLDVNGTVKIRDLPPGEGTPVVADAEGNLFAGDGIISNDSLTYTVISGYGPAIATGTYPLGSFNIGGASGEGIMVLNLTKAVDRNTAGFLNLFAIPNTNSVVIEIDVYKAGSNTPYASHKFSQIQVLAFSQAYPAAEEQSETFTIGVPVYGFFDHVNGTSFAYDLLNSVEIAYGSF
ncbi:hypothetical protein [Flavilitoribacter nigricans]|uniref:Uncharacterized protein n=1 Tax=Flavilitoribacter nigricans (strain ATCC 23147 / DSM 23189 / NBRC 102662 / NCIMB 1420 / SS-2) TaxID=1122177 RepID=A0A2D0N3N9_FLAN2|nr:hypothetical protein [Flavilitoribacter nigricans]PHN02996.1 hypothetical protein CRP01_29780 [Flavilitoribacter nigricans DSM 23189 = NBRC 102662]